MKKFLIILIIVLLGIGVLAACAPVEKLDLPDVSDVTGYVRTLPTWAIVVGAIVLFFIGFGIIWKLIPGFVKFIALIILVVAIVGISLGLWSIFGVDKETIDKAGSAIESFLPQSGESPR